MASFGKFFVKSFLAESIEVLSRTADTPEFGAGIETAAQLVIDSLRQNGKVLLCGNGGSAADAQHIAGEFVSRFYFDRPGLPAIALTVDSSVLTAIGNDYGYTEVFRRQVQALGQAGDVLFAISTSGSSPNILAAVKEARARSMKVVAMTGGRGQTFAAGADAAIVVSSDSTPLIQQAHIVAAHAVCAAVEAAMFADHAPR